jgi:hypothetical protein
MKLVCLREMYLDECTSSGNPEEISHFPESVCVYRTGATVNGNLVKCF